MKTLQEIIKIFLGQQPVYEIDAVQEYQKGRYFFQVASTHHEDYIRHHLASDLSQQDERNAMWNFLSSALRGYPQAQYELGMAYFLGHLGLAQDYTIAEQWLKRAAVQGHIDAQEQLNEIYQLYAFS
jgi:uncharacterized protein